MLRTETADCIHPGLRRLRAASDALLLAGAAASPTAVPMPLMMRLFVNELMQNLSMSSAAIR